MDNVSTGVLDETKEDYLKSKYETDNKAYDASRHIRLYMSKKKKKNYDPLFQSYSPTVVQQSISKT